MTMMMILAMLGCTTHVGVKSAVQTDRVSVVRGGPMPTEGVVQGVTVASGEGVATARTTYVVGRRFWAVAENDEGMTVTRIRNQGKPGPIVGCTLSALFFFPTLPSCLYVSGPTSDITMVQSPTRP